MNKKVMAAMMGISIGAGLLLSACGGSSGATLYELSSYQGTDYDENGRSKYNKALFYANYNQYGNPDPFVLDNTAYDGYYYLYATDSYMRSWRSQNLTDWEEIGTVLNIGWTGTDADRAVKQDAWASEVVRDDDTGKYYMYFSASPAADTSITEDGGGAFAPMDSNIHSLYNMYVAQADTPEGPFTLIDFTDPNSCGAENVHNYNTTVGIRITDANRDKYKTTVVQNDVEYARAFPQDYAKYLAFSPDEFIYAWQHAYDDQNYEIPLVANGGTAAAIDPHPFVDPDTGTKYLYFVVDKASGQVGIAGVEMENWLKPKWETFKFLSHPTYYTTDDYISAMRDNKGVMSVSYENSTNTINEGPTVVKHDGKYYLTFSINGYRTSSYEVAQAVADSPLGPFRKLTEEEGGLLMSALTVESQPAGDTSTQAPSGTGHHAFVTAGDQMFIVYHRHKDYEAAGSDRYTALDEIKWVTNDDGETVMYANGPTDSYQPKPEAFSDYENIAPQATVTTSSEEVENVEALTDGLLSMQKSYGFADFVKETTFTKTTDFTFTFDTPQTVAAIMLYNSKTAEDIFRTATVKLVCEDESGKEITKEIPALDFDVDQYCSTGGLSGDVTYVMSGAAAAAEFYDQTVKSITVTVPVPENQEQVGLSEIRILGRK